MLAADGPFIAEHGVLGGFDAVVWLIVLLNGLGGLLVAATMKYADNIVKCFAAALAILSGPLLSIPLFGFQPYGEGEYVFDQGEEGDAFYVIISGDVIITVSYTHLTLPTKA